MFPWFRKKSKTPLAPRPGISEDNPGKLTRICSAAPDNPQAQQLELDAADVLGRVLQDAGVQFARRENSFFTLDGLASIHVEDNTGSNVITGNDGNNVVYVSGGADVVHGGNGSDFLYVNYYSIGPASIVATGGLVTDGGANSVNFDSIEGVSISTGSDDDSLITDDGDYRLNSGGANLSDQEFRNSLIVMTDPTFMDWLEGLRANPQFQSTVAPSERQAKEQYDLELVVRYLTLQNRDEGALNRFKDLRELLTPRLLYLWHGQ